jgi:hypothetical protein
MEVLLRKYKEDENKEEYLKLVNNSRYILRDLVYAEKRGVTYHKLKDIADKSEDNMEKSLFYEGFGLVFYDLTVIYFINYFQRIILQHMKIYHLLMI